MNIDICICTFRRQHIAATLRSLATLALAPDWQLRIIVADNDETPSAEALVRQTAQETGLNVHYVHAPARNISIARNACLDTATAPLVAFIDDDELVTPNWLKALLETQAATQAEAVLGPVHALYTATMPSWMHEGDFHATLPVWVNDRIITGYTCNVLMNRSAPAFSGLRFRPELGRTGGEDTAFFSTLHERGGSIVYAPDAILNEPVTPERASFLWLLRRRYRSGQTHGMLLLEKNGDSLSVRLRQLVRAGGKLAFCSLVALGNCLRPVRMYFWMLRGAVHAGVISRLLGKNILEQYG